MPPGLAVFRLSDWLPYLTACRVLARQCGLTLRQVDRALWIGDGGQALPGTSRARRTCGRSLG
ncbi:MAG: hypothetical protein ACLP4W_10340 [Mycobacterium sp.]|uniref:hypothetical protein n=1 Tax=Mycobacterium sp. TaxID=1785 RepID=UPI003F9DA0A8